MTMICNVYLPFCGTRDRLYCGWHFK